MDKKFKNLVGLSREQLVKELKLIRTTEKTRDAHTRIGFLCGKGKSKGIKFIHKENQDGTKETITDKFAMV